MRERILLPSNNFRENMSDLKAGDVSKKEDKGNIEQKSDAEKNEEIGY